MYHIGLIGIFILLLCNKNTSPTTFGVIILLFLLIIIFYFPQQFIIVIFLVVISITLFIVRKRGSKIINLATKAVPYQGEVVFGIRFGMDKEEVSVIVSDLIVKNKIWKKGSQLYSKLPNGEEVEIYFYYKSDKLTRIRFLIHNFPLKSLKKLVHKEMIEKQYDYYRSIFFNKRCYIKQNIIVYLYSLPSGMERLFSKQYTTYIDCKNVANKRPTKESTCNISDF